MNKNKWIPLTAYNYASVDFMLFAKMRKSGIISFRTKRITRLDTNSGLAGQFPLDLKKQFDQVLADGDDAAILD